MKTWIIIFIFLWTHSGYSQLLQESNLPIIIINSFGEIPDEPKVNGTINILWNEDGSTNYVAGQEPHFTGSIGIELRGQTSQSLFPKKGYGIEIRDVLGEDLDTTIMDMPSESDWVIHSPYSDKSLIRNAMAYSLAGLAMDYAPRVQLCELELNGDYQGVVLWTEKIKRDKNRVNINKLKEDELSGDDLTGGYIVRFDKHDSDDDIAWISPYKPEFGAWQDTRFIYSYPKKNDMQPEQLSYISSWITSFENTLKSASFDDPINGYSKFIDVQSFIDYILHTELTRNVDGYRLSTYMYKEKDSDGGKLHLGPVWDHNLAFGNADYCAGGSSSGWAWDFNNICEGDYWLNHFWFKRLLEDPNFESQLRARWFELRDNEWSSENIMDIFENFVSELQQPQSRNFQRWPILGQWVWPNNYVGNSHQSEVTYMKNWINSRLSWLDGAIGNFVSANENISMVSNRIKVFPNPAKDVIHLQFDFENFTDLSMTIINVLGEIVSEEKINQNLHQINVSQYSKGHYSYQIKSKDKLIVSDTFVVLE